MHTHSYAHIKAKNRELTWHLLLKCPCSIAIPQLGDIKQTSNGWQTKLFITRNQVSLSGGVASLRQTTPLSLQEHVAIRLGSGLVLENTAAETSCRLYKPDGCLVSRLREATRVCPRHSPSCVPLQLPAFFELQNAAGIRPKIDPLP